MFPNDPGIFGDIRVDLGKISSNLCQPNTQTQVEITEIAQKYTEPGSFPKGGHKLVHPLFDKPIDHRRPTIITGRYPTLYISETSG